MHIFMFSTLEEGTPQYVNGKNKNKREQQGKGG